jgi:hypothetical protein
MDPVRVPYVRIREQWMAHAAFSVVSIYKYSIFYGIFAFLTLTGCHS